MANLTLNTASETAIDLEHLAESALRADMAAKEAAEKAKELKDQLKEALDKAGKLNGDTKAVGNARTVIKRVRRFDEKTALQALTEGEVEAYSVRKLDSALLKKNFAPTVYEELFSKDFGFSLELKVND